MCSIEVIEEQSNISWLALFALLIRALKNDFRWESELGIISKSVMIENQGLQKIEGAGYEKWHKIMYH